MNNQKIVLINGKELPAEIHINKDTDLKLWLVADGYAIYSNLWDEALILNLKTNEFLEKDAGEKVYHQITNDVISEGKRYDYGVPHILFLQKHMNEEREQAIIDYIKECNDPTQLRIQLKMIEPTSRISEAVALNHPSLIKCIKNQTPELSIMALENVSDEKFAQLFATVIEQTPEVCMYAIKREPRMFTEIYEQTPELCVEAAKADCELFSYCYKQTFEQCIAVIKEVPEAIEYIRDDEMKQKVKNAIKPNLNDMINNAEEKKSNMQVLKSESEKVCGNIR